MPPFMPPFVPRREAAARRTEAGSMPPLVDGTQLARLLPSAGAAETVPVELSIMEPEVAAEALEHAVVEPTGFEHAAYESAAAEILTGEPELWTPGAASEGPADDTSSPATVEFAFEAAAASEAEPVDEAVEATEEYATADWAQAEPGWTAPDEDRSAEPAPPAALSELDEAVALEVWEPESLEEVWDPTDIAEPTAAADDAAEWPDSPAEEPAAERAWWLSVPPEPSAQPETAGGLARHDDRDLQHVADRVAGRLEELAQDVRRRGLAALGAGMPEDERLRLDELSKLIAAVAAGFYVRDE
jgi:hypothetical protein